MNTKTMKAIGVIGIGDYDKYKEVQVPLPTVNPDDLLVKIKGVGVGTFDFEIRTGLYPNYGTPEAPQVIGYDGSGIVEEVGSNVKGFAKGDEVYFAGDATKPGNYSDFAVVDHRIAAKKPKKITFAESAGVPLVFLTAYEAMIDSAQISTDPSKNKGKSIFIIGGAGGVGSMAIQIAKHYLGLTVITTASRPESREFAIAQGADYVIDYKKPLKEGFEANGVKEVDYTFVAQLLNNDYLKQSSELTKPFGKIIYINSSEPLDALPLLTKVQNLCVAMMFARSMYQIEPEKQGDILSIASKLIDEGKIKHTSKVTPYTFEGYLETQKILEGGKAIGKITLEWN